MESLEKLTKKVNALEKSLQNNHAKVQVQVDIQEFNLKELNLEELAFHLDKLDIQELSGMLNLGNTFSPMVTRKKSEEKAKRRQPNPLNKNNKEIKINISGKPVPYSFNSGKDDERE
ncbi:hypothetical protein [Heyndrickxia acidicola]|uniref:Uncharacterized protein n=2 Tax=Heyndrickxia acidicola TaxID=209389 RepID=A0ABU6MIV7_9BACI|nr:hypothetical protein [Heyndrickxia acidicola]